MTLRKEWIDSQIKEISETYPYIIDIECEHTLDEYVFTVWFWVIDGSTGEMEKDIDVIKKTYERE